MANETSPPQNRTGRDLVDQREAGPHNHHDDKVDSDQEVVNKEETRRTVIWLSQTETEVVTETRSSNVTNAGTS